MEIFCGLDATRSIADLSEDEFSIKDLVDMFSFFVFQVAKKYGTMYSTPNQEFFSFFYFELNYFGIFAFLF
jgi:hypothetical protein